mgnify:CR=1 FL=1
MSGCDFRALKFEANLMGLKLGRVCVQIQEHQNFAQKWNAFQPNLVDITSGPVDFDL